MILTVAVLALTVLACSRKPEEAPAAPRAELDAWAQVSAERLLAKTKVLASDEFEGRAPGTRGEELTVRFLETEFKEMGLKPGNPDGTYVQKVPLVGVTPDPAPTLAFRKQGAAAEPLSHGDDFVANSAQPEDETQVNAEMVFVGYGVVAPEFDWDDYKGVDVRGKILVMLVNDPPVADERVFGGKAMTYYGRWTYKYEIAETKGAAGCLIVHETEPAGYPWGVVESGWTGEQFTLPPGAEARRYRAANGWISLEKARELFTAAGQDFDALKKAAVERTFKPVPLGVNAVISIRNKIRRIESQNVVARLDGADAALGDEYVLYMAHWDHLGRGPAAGGDDIYNGARDNAAGTAGLLEIARAFRTVNPPPKRTVLFLAVTAEEKGLLGSQYYAENPLYPLERTLAVLNMDAPNVWGETRDFVVIGLGNSTLDDHVRGVAREQGRVVVPDTEPEKGYFYRSDHFNFAKKGVPALYPYAPVDYVLRPAGWGLDRRRRYTAQDYHKPSDEVKVDWDLRGEVNDLRLLLSVGYRVANAAKWPEWNPGTEFKTTREAMLGKAASDKKDVTSDR
jgi:Zn-dependent M28 family amino/carboxypeptidase